MKKRLFIILPMILLSVCFLFVGCGGEPVSSSEQVFVKLYFNNGMTPAMYSMPKYKKIELPDMREIEEPKSFLTFDCWCEDSNLENPFDTSREIEEDTSLYARWKFKQNFGAMQVLSNSMAASGINKGDISLIQAVMISEIKVGDIIAFYICTDFIPNVDGDKETADDFLSGQSTFDTSIVLHKVYKIQYDSYGNTWFRTYGTSNLHVDGDPNSGDIPANYRVDKETQGDHIIGKFVETYNDYGNYMNEQYIPNSIMNSELCNSIHFNTNNIDCIVSGVITGIENPQTLDILSFNMNSNPSSHCIETWQSNKLYFEKDKSIAYIITIQNCGNNVMFASIKDNISYNDLNKSYIFNNQIYDLDTKVEINKGETKSFIISMVVEDESSLFINTAYCFDITLE